MKTLLAFLVFFNISIGNAQSKLTSTNSEQKINALLSQMTLEDKVGQMTELTIETVLKMKNGEIIEPHEIDTAKLIECVNKYKIGSLLNVGGNAQTRETWIGLIKLIQKLALQNRLKIPVLYGIDAIRGNNYTLNSVLFPQEIAQAASFNPQLIENIGKVTAYETRASLIPWSFSPVLDLGRQPLWPRIWETYGEDPYLAIQMGKAAIKGLQGDKTAIDKYHVAACLKHYIGYSFPMSGHDRTPAWIPENELREYFLPTFETAVKDGAKTVMANSGEINGVPGHANKHLLTDILKNELGFKGFVVSDWGDIENLYQGYHIAKDNKEAVMIAVNAGVDMSMVPNDFSFYDDLIELVKEHKISMSRINDAVTRILRVKFDAGLFDDATGNPADYSEFNSTAHNKLNYDAASECITLLKDSNNILPILIGKKILVTGPSANSMRSLNGGWSRNWQGDNSDSTEKDKNTILEAVQNVFGNANVEYSEGCSFTATTNIKDAVNKAAAADIIVLCIGETSYAETPGNINDLTISAPQIELAKALAATGKPIVFVLTEGRPRIISAIEPLASAIIQTYLLGNEGGNVVADVLSGKINPSGRLPYTYPRYPDDLVNYYHRYLEDYNPQWAFGFGSSYTQFTYSNLKISNTKLYDNKPVKVMVDVRNAGKVAGKETVLLYARDLVASITPEVKRLRAFDKINLAPGETKTVSFTITKNDISFINADLKRVTEHGDFQVSVSNLNTTFTY